MAYWDGPWASEDGGAARVQAASGRAPAGALSVVSRDAPGVHMVIVRAVDEVYLYGSTFGAGSTAWVERLDATTLETLARRRRPRGRSVVAGRHRRARERLTPRRARSVGAPALGRPASAGGARIAAGSCVQLLRRTAGRSPRHQGSRDGRQRAVATGGARSRVARDRRRRGRRSRSVDRAALGRPRRRLSRRRSLRLPLPVGWSTLGPRCRLVVPLSHRGRPVLRMGSGDRRRARVVHGQRRTPLRGHDARPRRRFGPRAPRARRGRRRPGSRARGDLGTRRVAR